MGLRKNKGIPDHGNVKLEVSLRLSTAVDKDKNSKELAKIVSDTTIPFLLKKSHLKTAEKLFLSHLKNTVIGQFQTEVLCIIKELITDELVSELQKSSVERLPLHEEGGSQGEQ
jgi:hypothetical protein